jgi:hypothetical protein
MNLHDQKAKILQATKQAPEGGDFVWGGVDEGDHALDKQALPLFKAQQQELDRRYQAYQNGQLSLHDWEAVHQALRNK